MNTNYPDLIYNGIIICLCLQLVILGVIKLFSKDIRGVILGVLCLFMASGTIYNFWWAEFNDLFIYNLLLGGQKTLFFGSLIFLYLKLVTIDNRTAISKCLAFFLIPPLVISLVYLLIKFSFKPFYSSHFFEISIFINLIHVFIYIYFLFVSKSLFKESKVILKSEIYTRYLIFYLALLVYFLVWSLDTFITLFTGRSQDVFLTINKYIYSPLDVLSKGGLILFVFFESKRVKSFLYGKNIYASQNNIKEEKLIEKIIHKYLIEEKVFLNSDFNLSELLKKKGVSGKDFKNYVKKVSDKSYNEFINDIKVEEFKRNILASDNDVFDIASIAKISGFKSKATFYRIFKAKEGITPQEYKLKKKL